ncbi:DUF4926 domain-containing protein [Methylobacterium sp. J-076]|uniref:DUF4926 domain-containing protein n=1 Tax=Methylobacterium sp. J-076 TaxID=2836655 RepID=UPI001FBB2E3E|nr:DUF4926 domain-containing protein [Methylobacterium sp. J-076]MCJ2012056.1 DUF4926 domain-containing protein [Methylobacterium sp. J-076]
MAGDLDTASASSRPWIFKGTRWLNVVCAFYDMSALAYSQTMAEQFSTHLRAAPDRRTLRADRIRPKFDDLDQVRVLAAVEADGGVVLPVGSIGTVVARWAHGVAFEIEFTAPIKALATVEARLLKLVERGSPHP